jgi:hypothetical protein
MGLDMYAYRMTDFQPSTPTDFGSELSELREHNIEAEEFHYWRKHPDMHGLMEKIYREKEGKEETFNCTPVQLVQADLDRIREQVQSKALPKTEGFFFGESDDSDYDSDMDFLRKAEASLKEGYTIWYDSWW